MSFLIFQSNDHLHLCIAARNILQNTDGLVIGKSEELIDLLTAIFGPWMNYAQPSQLPSPLPAEHVTVDNSRFTNDAKKYGSTSTKSSVPTSRRNDQERNERNLVPAQYLLRKSGSSPANLDKSSIQRPPASTKGKSAKSSQSDSLKDNLNVSSATDINKNVKNSLPVLTNSLLEKLKSLNLNDGQQSGDPQLPAQVDDEPIASLYPCSLCSKVFASKQSLTRHQDSKHNNSSDKNLPKEEAKVQAKAENDAVTCDICLKSFSSAAALQSHTSAKHNKENSTKSNPPPTTTNNSVECDCCLKLLESPAKLTIHQKEVHRFVTCLHCQKRFSTETALDEHLLELHREVKVSTVRQSECKFCDKVFSKSSAIDDHLANVHKISTSFGKTSVKSELSFDCFHCEQRFLTVVSLQHHWKDDHNTLACALCHEGFTSDSAVFNHLNFDHGRGLSFFSTSQCAYCSDSFNSLPSLVQHQWTLHKIRACDTCLRTFNSKTALKEHRKEHESSSVTVSESKTAVDEMKASGLISCDLCPTAASSIGALQQHRRTVHKVVEKVEKSCLKCGESFLGDYQYDAHRIAVHNEKLKIHPYECDYCVKSFATKMALNAHLEDYHKLNHSLSTAVQMIVSSAASKGDSEPPKKTFPCTECNIQLDSKEKLKAHKKTHTKVTCEQCRKVFKNSSDLQQHADAKHR